MDERDYRRLVQRFGETGLRADAAHRAVKEAFRDGLRDRNPAAYSALLAVFHQVLRDVYVPFALAADGTFDGLAAIDRGDRDAIAVGCAFLEASPEFFRSGYTKDKLIRRLKRVAFEDDDMARLWRIVEASVQSTSRTPLHALAQLVAKLPAADLIERLGAHLARGDDRVKRRAAVLLSCLVPEGDPARGNLEVVLRQTAARRS